MGFSWVFLNVGTIDIWGWIILCRAGLYCTLFDVWHFSGLYPPDASCTPLPLTFDKIASKHCQKSPRRPKFPLVENNLDKASHGSSRDLRRETEEGTSTREPSLFGAISVQTPIAIIISEHCLLQESPFLISAHDVGPCLPLSNGLLILFVWCPLLSLAGPCTLHVWSLLSPAPPLGPGVALSSLSYPPAVNWAIYRACLTTCDWTLWRKRLIL